MFGLFGRKIKSAQYEILFLVSQAVKSGHSLSQAIRMTVMGDHREDRPFLQFADLLDRGTLPAVAARQAGFPSAIRRVVAQSCDNPYFADAFVLQSQQALIHDQTTLRILHMLAYPLWLLTTISILIYLFFLFVTPNFESIYSCFDTELPEITQLTLVLTHMLQNGISFLAIFILIFLLSMFRRLLVPRLWYLAPSFGPFWLRLWQSEFYHTVAFSLRREVSLETIFVSVAKETTNRGFRNDLLRAATEVAQGHSFCDVMLRYPWLFPVWVVPILASCERADTLADTLDQVAHSLESRMESSMLILQTTVLFYSVSLLGIILGIMILSLMVPLIKTIEFLSM